MEYEKLTPMMKQYVELKEKYQDTILFYRLGDFYEMFFDDALVASRVLEIALTGRNAGLDEKIPMCGVPYHSCEPYIKKLIDNGFKVAICEQLEDANEVKGIVKRDVVKIITPGTNYNVEEVDHNYIMYLDESKPNFYYIALCDIATGKLKALKVVKDINVLYNEILSYNIKELVVNQKFDTRIFNDLLKSYKFLISFNDIDSINDNEVLKNIEVNFKDSFNELLNYIENTQKTKLDYFMDVEYLDDSKIKLEFSTKFNLELINTIKNNDKYGTLYWYLDKTKTAMGSRLLKEYIEAPLKDIDKIKYRQDFVTGFIEEFINTEMLVDDLKNIYDIARISAKIGVNNVIPKELLWLKKSLDSSNRIIEILKNYNNKVIKEFVENVDVLDDLCELINTYINEDILEGDNSKIINDGVSEQLDQYRSTMEDSTQWLVDFEQRQRDLTGIKTLKVKYNKVFGYYIEVSNANKDLIKDEFGYVRKQTLTNAERYINSELKEQEAMILNAQDNTTKLEQEIYSDFKVELKQYILRLQMLSKDMAFIDVMYSFYKISNQYGYNKPEFNEDYCIDIKESFHPIIKEIDKNREFINNDFYLDDKVDVILITGPNMGGKSTYMRQLAIIVIMAQIGCFVPAQEANLMLFEQIYTRIGASDDLVRGQSTFMVEMLEASNAILNANKHSLILFDEIGRGTATYDGMSIAYAMIEYISQFNKSKLLFSTHYHELVQLEQSHDNIKNYHASVIENNNEITFTYKVEQGSIDNSYGIHVAKLANLPSEIISRANQLLKEFEKEETTKIGDVKYIEVDNNKYDDVIKSIDNVDINSMTPIQALSWIEGLKNKVVDINE
ncbi:MAG: DNA mismatch repair protein MutS [Erysipelotrichales bacterium]